MQRRGIRDTGRIVCRGVGARERDKGHRSDSVPEVWVQGRGIRDKGRIVCRGVGARERDKGHRSDSVLWCGCKGEG